jgi:hypothetical protein
MVGRAWRRSGMWTRTAGVVVWAGLACAGTASRAAQPTIESLPLAAAYGAGVHGYFAGDYDRSYEDLTSAIEAGTNDPRVYYFRGLAALRLGRTDEAEADFTEGANRESEGLGGWPVARSLERVQGPDRLRLERHRTRARVALLQRQRAAEAERYSQIQEAQPDVLRRRRPVAPPVDAADEANPFEERRGPEPGWKPEPVPVKEPAVPAVPAEALPPAEPMPEPAAAPAAEEPLAQEPAAAEPAAQELATPEPAAADPFGDAVPAEELPAEREDAAADK